MCVHKPSGPSAAELAAQRTLAASAQGNIQDVSASAQMMNAQRLRRHFGLSSTVTGAGSSLGIGSKESLGM